MDYNAHIFDLEQQILKLRNPRQPETKEEYDARIAKSLAESKQRDADADNLRDLCACIKKAAFDRQAVTIGGGEFTGEQLQSCVRALKEKNMV